MPRVPSAQKRSQWQERLRRFARSELPVAAFCKRERVSAASFYHWKRKLAGSVRRARGRRPPESASFVPVQLAGTGVLQVSFPNGVQVVVPTSDPELVKTSIAALAQARTGQGDE